MDESNNNRTPNVVNETENNDAIEGDMDESVKLKDSSSKKNEKSTTSEFRNTLLGLELVMMEKRGQQKIHYWWTKV